MTTYERRQEIVKIIIDHDGISCARLADLTGVSLRTVRRDIDAISAYVPIWCGSGCRGGVHMMNAEKIP